MPRLRIDRALSVLAVAALAMSAAAEAADRGQGNRVRVTSTVAAPAAVRPGEVTTVVEPLVGRTGGVSSLRVQRGFLGVHLVELTAELRRHFGVPEDRGLLVGRVVAGSPAAEAGVAVGDILTAVEGEGMASTDDVHRRIRPRRDGDQVELTLVRERTERSLVATLRERERSQLDFSPLFLKPVEGRELLYNVDPRTFSQATKRLNRLLSERSQEERAIDERMQELERRLRQLERRLKPRSGQRDGRGAGER